MADSTESDAAGAAPEEADARTDAPADVTGSTVRRPNPAASAASRARRIGGATGTHKAAPAPVEQVSEPVKPADVGLRHRLRKAQPAAAIVTTDTSQTADPAESDTSVSMRKRQPRTTSARDLKAAANSASATVTEVPAWLRWVPAIVLSLCAVAMIVIIAVAAHGVWYAKPSTSTARDKVLAAAKRCTAVANTYNYKTLAADEKRGLACTTGAWTAQYKSALEKIVKPTATQLKASQTVQINSAGVESVTNNGKQWTTIVYGQLTINQAAATPRIDQFAAIVRMDKVKSSYLVSKIDLVTNPSG
ncbi:hypothetical protein [uncultured Jatrophihabitans sp.]|uniref:hypothetical protein n=1 Tax=uncultured Jatrophihabitans sp. TaxID=1610747 RepID=UPI0035CC4606